MEIKDLRALSKDELSDKISAIQQRLFELSRQKAVGQLEHPDEITGLRKDLARALTIKRERELQIPVSDKK